MFDLFVDAMFAWNQIGMLLMGSAFMLIGGGIAGYEIYWRLKATKTRGRISGVRVKVNVSESKIEKSEKKDGQTISEGNKEGNGKKQRFYNEMYYAVFEYQAPNGDHMEKVSDMGSNSLLNKLPGKRITLMVSPDNPEKVRRPSIMLLIFGLIFMFPGVIVMYMAVTSFKANIITILMVLAGLGFIAYKIWSFIQKIPEGEFKEGWAEFKKNGITVTPSGNKAKEFRTLDKSEINSLIKVHVKHSMITGYVMFFIALGLAGGAYYTGLDMLDMVQNGVSASGEVVSIKSRYSSSSDSSGYTYYAVVEYTYKNGHKIRFDDSVGSSQPIYQSGDKVDVLYKENMPEDAIIDRGLFNWGLSGGLALGFLLILLGAFRFISLARRYGGSRYRRRI